MEQVAAVVDAETYRKLRGFRCHISDCKRYIPGYVNELKMHFREKHKLNTSHVAKIPFVCSECGCLYKRFKHLKRHILLFHPPESVVGQPDQECATPYRPCNDAMENPENEPNYTGITNNNFFQPAISVSEMEKLAENFVTSMRCDVGLPETKVTEFMQATAELVKQSGRYYLGVFKSFLRKKSIAYDDVDVVNTINKFEISNLFVNVSTPKNSLSYLSGKAGYPVPIPREEILGQTKVTKVTKVPPRVRGHPKNIVRKTKKLKDSAHYISIIDTLALIVQNVQALESVRNEVSQNGILLGFKDGERYKHHPFLIAHPDALRLAVHIDDVEYLNPLGSRKGNKKLTNISIKIENFNSIINSQPERIYLTLSVQTKVLKKYGYARTLRPFIEDLRRLESDEGVKIKVRGQVHVLRAVLVHVVGDTLAIHEVFELMGPQAKLFCRMCYITRVLLHQGFFGEVHHLKTPESIRADLETVASKQKTPSDCGVIRECSLHQLKYFNIALNNTFDPMHDILEGIGPMIIKLILNNLVNNQKLISAEKQQFDQGFQLRHCGVKG